MLIKPTLESLMTKVDSKYTPLSSLPFPFSLCNDKCFSMRQRILFHRPSLPFNPFLSSSSPFFLHFSLFTRVYIL